MKCPHCRVAFHSAPQITPLAVDHKRGDGWVAMHEVCPSCGRIIIALANGTAVTDNGRNLIGLRSQYGQVLVHPAGVQRLRAPTEVSESIAEDYDEACAVLQASPKAAAALARRCLQAVLREKAGVKPGDLFDEIDRVLAGGLLPSGLAESIDAIRATGNFATHPIKRKGSAEIVPVESGEAEWSLDVLESLFDHYYVQPKVIEAKRAALNDKLAAAGKPPLKAGSADGKAGPTPAA